MGRKRKAEQLDFQASSTIIYPKNTNYSSQTTTLGSSSNPIVLDSPPAPKPKRQRRARDTDAPVPEKRAAITKRKCPQNILERLARVRDQRFFMVERKREGKELREEFEVLGSTGNVYTVVIDKMPSCNCPDALKGNHCKHILFIYTKVLQVPYTSHVWYQKAVLTIELEEIFANAPPAPNDIINNRVREAYAWATGKAVASSSSSSSPKKRVPEPDTDCPVCYESMHGTKEIQLAFCESCGNCLHKQCFDQWARTKGRDITCVYCRAKWTVGDVAAAGGSRVAQMSEGYLNLGNVAGLSPERDTSTYYHGPRRGQSYYGYQRYR